MQEDNLEEPKENLPPGEAPESEPQRSGRRYFTRRNALFLAAGVALLIVVLGLLSVVLYRYGTLDTVIKAQFVEKMNNMGISWHTIIGNEIRKIIIIIITVTFLSIIIIIHVHITKLVVIHQHIIINTTARECWG